MSAPLLMGIVNATPDSFSDPQGAKSLDELVARAHRLASDGAGLIDVGGESGRTDRPAVPVEEEAGPGGAADRAPRRGRADGFSGYLARAGGACGTRRGCPDGQRRERAERSGSGERLRRGGRTARDHPHARAPQGQGLSPLRGRGVRRARVPPRAGGAGRGARGGRSRARLRPRHGPGQVPGRVDRAAAPAARAGRTRAGRCWWRRRARTSWVR